MNGLPSNELPVPMENRILLCRTPRPRFDPFLPRMFDSPRQMTFAGLRLISHNPFLDDCHLPHFQTKYSCPFHWQSTRAFSMNQHPRLKNSSSLPHRIPDLTITNQMDIFALDELLQVIAHECVVIRDPAFPVRGNGTQFCS